MQPVVIGLNHKTAPVEVREEFSVSEEQVHTLLRRLPNENRENIQELLILSTCNRTEIYCVVAKGQDSFNIVREVFLSLAKLKEEAQKYLYYHTGTACIGHLFRVSASLDSLVIGEGQILSQVKKAYSMARDSNAAGTVLNTLFNRAIKVGKRVRAETRIAYNAISVSYAAVEQVKKNTRDITKAKVLILGAGEMSELTARHLVANGVKTIFVSNRNYDRATQFAERFKGTAIPFDNLLTSAADADIIITSTGAPHYILRAWDLAHLMPKRPNKPLMIIDIAVPRDVEPEAAAIAGVSLYNIDDLEAVVEANLQERAAEAALAEEIIIEEQNELVARFRYLTFQPTLARLADKAERMRRHALKKAMIKMPELTATERRVVENLSKLLVRKLLRDPAICINQAAGSAQAEELLEAVNKLFQLEEFGEKHDYEINEKKLVIGTRGSKLALWQANYIKGLLEVQFPAIEIQLKHIITTGDRILDVPLAKIGSKGLFTKEIELALLSGEIDMAVHSLKDMPTVLPEGLTLAAITKREQPADALISPKYQTLDSLPVGAVVGTSSLRRRAQLLAYRPDLQIVDLRGNLDTRLKKLQDENLAAIILAAAGLIRLGWDKHITELLPHNICLPAVGQGALTVEARSSDSATLELLQAVEDYPTRQAVTAKRAYLHRVEGGCQTPVGVYAWIAGNTTLKIEAVLLACDGSAS